LFVQRGHWSDDVWVDDDYHLQAGSPCIDAGDPSYVPDIDERDVYGGPRIIRGRIDIGADEGIPNEFADTNIDGVTNFVDYSFLAKNWPHDSCLAPRWCDNSDLDWNGLIDITDLIILAENWLWPLEPNPLPTH
jgi:hypothetical protein